MSTLALKAAAVAVARWFLVLRPQKEKVEILLDAVEILRRKEKEQKRGRKVRGSKLSAMADGAERRLIAKNFDFLSSEEKWERES